jgi:hypothetical protein
VIRSRPFLAVLLAFAWFGAAWHCDLEAAGLLYEHDHHAHSDAGHGHSSPGTHDDHEQFLARTAAKDPVRLAALPSPWLFPAVLGLWLVALRPPPPLVRLPGRDQDPPLARLWHFLRRCVAASAAPPRHR